MWNKPVLTSTPDSCDKPLCSAEGGNKRGGLRADNICPAGVRGTFISVKIDYSAKSRQRNKEQIIACKSNWTLISRCHSAQCKRVKRPKEKLYLFLNWKPARRTKLVSDHITVLPYLKNNMKCLNVVFNNCRRYSTAHPKKTCW